MGGCPAGQIPLTAPSASFLCSLLPLGPVCFLLCMSVITSTVDLLARRHRADVTNRSLSWDLVSDFFLKKQHNLEWTLLIFPQYGDKCKLLGWRFQTHKCLGSLQLLSSKLTVTVVAPGHIYNKSSLIADTGGEMQMSHLLSRPLILQQPWETGQLIIVNPVN